LISASALPFVWGAKNEPHLQIRIFRERALNFDIPQAIAAVHWKNGLWVTTADWSTRS